MFMLTVVAGGGMAQGQEPMQNRFVNQDALANFWVGEDLHTLVSVGSPKRYQVCNLPHTGLAHIDMIALEITADGTTYRLLPGTCIDVEATVITARTPTPDARAVGSYRAID
jgi:hypothetical protein